MNELIQEIKEVKKWGNSGGISVPKELIGQLIKITIEPRTNKIKEEILEILSPYLEDIIGIYLTGSYARNEQEEESDIDVIAISNSTSKSIKSGKYNIEINKISSIENALKKHPILVLPRLIEAKVIMNKSLLEKLKKINITKKSFRLYFEECKRIYKILKESLIIDKELEKTVDSFKGTVYSLILRLRGLYLYKCIITNKNPSKNGFKEYIISKSKINEIEFNQIYSIYALQKEDKKIKTKISIELLEKILPIMKKEINSYYDKKKKTP